MLQNYLLYWKLKNMELLKVIFTNIYFYVQTNQIKVKYFTLIWLIPLLLLINLKIN